MSPQLERITRLILPRQRQHQREIVDQRSLIHLSIRMTQIEKSQRKEKGPAKEAIASMTQDLGKD